MRCKLECANGVDGEGRIDGVLKVKKIVERGEEGEESGERRNLRWCGGQGEEGRGEVERWDGVRLRHAAD